MMMRKLSLILLLTLSLSLLKAEAVSSFVYDSHRKRDPFVPLTITPVAGKVVETEGPIDFSLEGIVWDEKKPLAIINEEILGVGDEVPGTGAKVEKIEKERVILKYQGREFILQ